MTIERSKGKARPTLPRASDLEPAETAAKPSEARTPDGRFSVGNRAAVAARFTATIRKALGSKAGSGDALVVARDARRVFGHVLASLPSDAAPVRALLTIYARHQALHAYYTVCAEAAGLDTERGLELLVVADRQSQRAERVLVTVHDLARVHAATRPDDFAAEVERANREAAQATARRREEERQARAAIDASPSEGDEP